MHSNHQDIAGTRTVLYWARCLSTRAKMASRKWSFKAEFAPGHCHFDQQRANSNQTPNIYVASKQARTVVLYFELVYSTVIWSWAQRKLKLAKSVVIVGRGRWSRSCAVVCVWFHSNTCSDSGWLIVELGGGALWCGRRGGRDTEEAMIWRGGDQRGGRVVS
jgi:hypothetical protein